MGIASSVRNHSPLKALTSQLLSPSAELASSKARCEVEAGRAIVNHPIRIVEVNAVIGIGEKMYVIILHACKIESIQESKRVLHVDIVVRHAVHHQETDISLQGGHVADRGILVAIRIILRGLHVSFRVDGVWQPTQSASNHTAIHKSLP